MKKHYFYFTGIFTILFIIISIFFSIFTEAATVLEPGLYIVPSTFDEVSQRYIPDYDNPVLENFKTYVQQEVNVNYTYCFGYYDGTQWMPITDAKQLTTNNSIVNILNNGNTGTIIIGSSEINDFIISYNSYEIHIKITLPDYDIYYSDDTPANQSLGYSAYLSKNHNYFYVRSNNGNNISDVSCSDTFKVEKIKDDSYKVTIVDNEWEYINEQISIKCYKGTDEHLNFGSTRSVFFYRCKHHEYTNGICNKCNDLEINHTWGMATCDSPHVCSDCGDTFGDVMEHLLKDGVCIYCNNTIPSKGLKFTSNGDGTCSVSCGTCRDETIIIPSISESGDTVTIIDDCGFILNQTLVNIAIPNTIKKIGDSAFEYCYSLSNIILPSSVEVIGEKAFRYCRSLENITISQNIKKIPDYAFESCSSLNNITIPSSVDTIGKYVFHDCKSLDNITLSPFIKEIPDYAFWGCTSLKSNLITNIIEKIGIQSFSDCNSLTSLYIPATLNDISSSAFTGCSGLEKIEVESGNTVYRSEGNCLINNNGIILGCKNSVIPDDENVTFISGLAFYGCTGLVNITIPGTISTIDIQAFRGCTSLETVDIEEGVRSIRSMAFERCESLTSLFIPSSITSISNTAFNMCSSLETIKVASNNRYFYDTDNCLVSRNKKTIILGCKNSVINDKSIQCIGENAFYKCIGLSSIIIPSNITKVESKAFSGCTNLTSLTIDSSIINEYAFEECINLSSIIMSPSIKVINGYAFYLSSPEKTERKIYFDGLENDWQKIKIEEGNESLINSEIQFSLKCNYHTNGDGTCSVSFEGNARNVVVPSSSPSGEIVTVISDNALLSVDRCEILTVPASITEFGDNLFKHGSLLKKVYYYGSSDTFEKIANYQNNSVIADSKLILLNNIGSKGLEYMPLGNGNAKIIGIGTCNDNELIIPSLTPNGEIITEISSDAFQNCNFTDVTLPVTITEIGIGAFAGCTKMERINLEDVEIFTIPNELFYGCEKLAGINIPSSVMYIGEYSFMDCTSLSNVKIGNEVKSVSKTAFNNCRNIDNIIFDTDCLLEKDGVVYELNNKVIIFVLKACSTTVTVPIDIKEIPDCSFMNRNLQTIILPDSVKYIGEKAFCGCFSLSTVLLPESLFSIGKYAFKDTNIKEIIIPKSVEYIGYGAFYNCFSLKQVINNSRLPLKMKSIYYGYVAYYAKTLINNNIEAVSNTIPLDLEISVDFLLSGIKDNGTLSDLEKLLLVHDRLAIWCEYPIFILESGVFVLYQYSTYSAAIVDRQAICSGYAAAFSYLLDELKIENGIITSPLLVHAWNYVVLDGEKYYVDCTWDNDNGSTRSGSIFHMNLLRSAQGLISTGHSKDEKTDFDLTVNDTKYDNYFWQNSYSEFCLFNNHIYYMSDNTIYEYSDGKSIKVIDIKGLGYERNILQSNCDGLYYIMGKTIYRFVPGNSPEVFIDFSNRADVLQIINFHIKGGTVYIELNMKDGYFAQYEIDMPAIDVSSHNLVTIKGVPATCSTAGKTDCVYCKDCLCVIQKSEDIPCVSHQYENIASEDNMISQATCVAPAYYHSICAFCGIMSDEIFADGSPLGHDFQWVTDKPATVKETGLKHEKCTRCDATRNMNTVIPVLEYSSAVSLTNSTITTAWGLDFRTTVYATQLEGEGAQVTLTYDRNIVKFKRYEASEGVSVTVDENAGTITVSSDEKLGEDEESELLTIVFTTSDELASGNYSFLSMSEEDTQNKAEFVGFTIYEIGDVNMDGKVNSRDVTMIKQSAVRMITLTDVQKAYADAYVDGNVNSRDATIITQYVVHMDVTLGDRVSVSFTDTTGTAGNTWTVNRSVHKGKTLTAPPEAPQGYAWSSSATSYVTPVYTDITSEKKYYLVKKES